MTKDQPLLTIGVPVLNGADTLPQALDNLLQQSFRDFKIIVSNNASSDETENIVMSYMRRDSRIVLFTQSKLISAIENFQFVLNKTDTPYFMWRADDDLSDLDYLEKLVAKLEKNKKSKLAVGNIKQDWSGRELIDACTFKPELYENSAVNPLETLFEAHASYYYGIWRSADCKRYFKVLTSLTDEAYASDHLLVLMPLLEGGIVGDNTTSFTQRIGFNARGDAPINSKRQRANFTKRTEIRLRVRRKFPPAYRSIVNSFALNNQVRRKLLKATDRYTTHRVTINRRRYLKWMFIKYLHHLLNIYQD